MRRLAWLGPVATAVWILHTAITGHGDERPNWMSPSDRATVAAWDANHVSEANKNPR